MVVGFDVDERSYSQIVQQLDNALARRDEQKKVLGREAYLELAGKNQAPDKLEPGERIEYDPLHPNNIERTIRRLKSEAKKAIVQMPLVNGLDWFLRAFGL